MSEKSDTKKAAEAAAGPETEAVPMLDFEFEGFTVSVPKNPKRRHVKIIHHLVTGYYYAAYQLLMGNEKADEFVEKFPTHDDGDRFFAALAKASGGNS